MAEWTFGYLLHNLSIRKPIENQWVAIVPKTDQRIQALISQHASIGRLINGFTDQFGRPRKPSIILVRSDAPKPVASAEALISFRNAVAVCSVAGAWVDFLNRDWTLPSSARYSDYFDIYPVLPGALPDLLVTLSPDLRGLDEAKGFAGQTSPWIGTTVTDLSYAPRLLESILNKWERRYAQGEVNEWQTTALFRSLEMAYLACSMPISNYSTIYDYGSKLALWVSAFEVLLRPQDGNVDLEKVVQLLQEAPFEDRRLRGRDYTVTRGQKELKVTLPQELYWELYDARNRFLHGNPASVESLLAFGKASRHPLNYFAPLVYSIALICYLNIQEYYRNLGDIFTDDYMAIRSLEEGLVRATVDNRKTSAPAN
jgi:hypothetical protein